MECKIRELAVVWKATSIFSESPAINPIPRRHHSPEEHGAQELSESNQRHVRTQASDILLQILDWAKGEDERRYRDDMTFRVYRNRITGSVFLLISLLLVYSLFFLADVSSCWDSSLECENASLHCTKIPTISNNCWIIFIVSLAALFSLLASAFVAIFLVASRSSFAPVYAVMLVFWGSLGLTLQVIAVLVKVSEEITTVHDGENRKVLMGAGIGFALFLIACATLSCCGCLHYTRLAYRKTKDGIHGM